MNLMKPLSVPQGLHPIEEIASARLRFATDHPKRNHHVFRFPAKFHAPIAAALIERFTEVGDTILDPFCGSGTSLVEAICAGRHAVGTDVDPLAILVTQAKTSRFDMARMARQVDDLVKIVEEMAASDEREWGSFLGDIPKRTFDAAIGPLAHAVPPLPRIEHWFRRRVIVQLAALRNLVDSLSDGDFRTFVLLAFAASIRNSSNADPVPVSGLEVTSHMLRKEAEGRLVDPYRIFVKALVRQVAAFEQTAADSSALCRSTILQRDARILKKDELPRVDHVVTSPPYMTAVDYYRRHTLEMFWLGLTADRDERLRLLPNYLGRDRVGQIHMPKSGGRGASVARSRLATMGPVKPERARAFTHYSEGMVEVFSSLESVLPSGGRLIMVVGDVKFCGNPVPMDELMTELAEPHFALTERLWYPLVNRYMSYTRKNDANIDSEHVLVFERR